MSISRRSGVRGALIAMVMAVLACSGGPVAAATVVRAVGITASDSGADIAIDLSKVTAYKLFTLANPERVVLDLPDARLARSVRMPGSEGIITAIRTADRPRRSLRLVLQLKAPLAAHARWASATDGASRLIVSMGMSEGRAGSRELEADPAPVPRIVRAAHAPAETGRDVVIAVDAGHGGQDPGATGHHGTHEKDVVLAIARALASRINAEAGMHAVLTRDRDEFLTLRDRIHRARMARADLFVSVHADSIRNAAVSGSSVYVLSERGATDEAARWLAERENAADLIGGVSLGDKDETLRSVLLDLSQSAQISASMSAAERVLGALERVGEVRKPSVQQAGFVVLKSPDIPSMLIETAYISNPGEERRLRTDSQQGKLAEAIFSGLRGYFRSNPPPGTHFAQARSTAVPGVLSETDAPSKAEALSQTDPLSHADTLSQTDAQTDSLPETESPARARAP